jgi:Raf kinase inhibitor-like YbhB/YbcL family protein
MQPRSIPLILLLVLWASAACPHPLMAQSSEMRLSSPYFTNGATMPDQFTCKGTDESPPLAWTAIPNGVKSLALIVEDPDAPGGTFVHWVAYNIPASSVGLPKGVPRNPQLAEGGEQGINSFGKIGYNGPCPPPGSPHHYHFKLYALDQEIDPGKQPRAEALEAAMRGHVKASAELVGIFGR